MNLNYSCLQNIYLPCYIFIIYNHDWYFQVNGVNVMQSTHTDVVQLIKCKFTYFLSFLRPLFCSFLFYFQDIDMLFGNEME